MASVAGSGTTSEARDTALEEGVDGEAAEVAGGAGDEEVVMGGAFRGWVQSAGLERPADRHTSQ